MLACCLCFFLLEGTFWKTRNDKNGERLSTKGEREREGFSLGVLECFLLLGSPTIRGTVVMVSEEF